MISSSFGTGVPSLGSRIAEVTGISCIACEHIQNKQRNSEIHNTRTKRRVIMICCVHRCRVPVNCVPVGAGRKHFVVFALIQRTSTTQNILNNHKVSSKETYVLSSCDGSTFVSHLTLRAPVTPKTIPTMTATTSARKTNQLDKHN
jgi:hypothetical protein